METSRTVKGGSGADYANPVPHLDDNAARASFFEGVARSEGAINDILSDVVYEATGSNRDLLEKGDLRNPDAKAYGCGAWGCAFPTLDPRWTIKVSADPREGPTVGKVFETSLRYHPGCAFILGIWQLPPVTVRQRGFDNTPFIPWIILREDVIPWRNVVREYGGFDADGSLIDEADIAVRNILMAAKHAGAIYNKAVGENNTEEAKNMLEFYWETLEILEQVPEFEALVGFLGEFHAKTGRVLADVHSGNIGYRQHNYTDVATADFTLDPPTLTVFDLGHSDTAVGADIPFIKNPDIRRRIPVIR